MSLPRFVSNMRGCSETPLPVNKRAPVLVMFVVWAIKQLPAELSELACVLSELVALACSRLVKAQRCARVISGGACTVVGVDLCNSNFVNSLVFPLTDRQPSNQRET